MAFFSKAGSLLRQTAGKHINKDIAGAKSSIYQVIRCMSSSKVFVGGLSYSTDDTSLREAFSKYGDVADARVIQDRETGRSRGFGFVTYATPDAASAAIQALDGQELHGRRVRVNYANDRPRGYGGGYAGYGNSGYGGGGNNYGGQDGFGSYSAGGSGGYAASGGDNYGSYTATGGDGYASGGNYQSGYNASGGGNYASGGYGYNAGGGNYASGGYGPPSRGSNEMGGNYASGNDDVGSGNVSYESNASTGDSFVSSDYDKSVGQYGGGDELGSDNSGNKTSTDPVDGDFRDDDDEPSDYANKRA